MSMLVFRMCSCYILDIHPQSLPTSIKVDVVIRPFISDNDSKNQTFSFIGKVCRHSLPQLDI